MDKKNVKILLIEDNPGDARLIRELLSEGKGMDFQMEWANGLTTGLNNLSVDEFDIILVDLGLPESQGLDTFTNIYAYASSIPIIILTVLNNENIAIKAVHEGAQDYLIKDQVDADSLVRSMQYAIERKKTEKVLLRTHEKLKAIFEGATDGILAVDIKSKKFSFVNPRICEITGYSMKELFKLNITKIHPKKDLKYILDQFEKQVEGKCSILKDISILRKDKKVIYCDINSKVLKFDKKEYFVGFYRDITERKHAEEQIKKSLKEKEVLLQEIHHRVKNNMQVISSLLKLQSRQIKDNKTIAMFKECQDRIRSMALVHEKLYESKDFANINFNKYIKVLANSLFRSYKIYSDKIALKLDVKDISLKVDHAIPCGLIINELVSNSLKYAFPNSKSGEIKITLCSDGDNDIQLVVSDNGIGIPKDLDFRNSESLGLHLVKVLVEDQLQGEIIQNGSNGTEFKINFKAVY